MKSKELFFDKTAKSLSKILNLLFVPKCVVCNDVLWENETCLCEECLKIWDKARAARCPVCSKTARACLCRPNSFSGVPSLGERYLSALAFYGKPDSCDERDLLVRKMISSVKKSADRRVVNFLARESAADILRYFAAIGEKPENYSICYPPRTKRKIRAYGFDQSEELAKEIAKYTGIKFEKCFRNVGETEQKTLNGHDRENNAKESLVTLKNADFKDKKYIFIDDVITSGATFVACYDIAMKSGAKLMYPFGIARTKRKKKLKRRKTALKLWFK